MADSTLYWFRIWQYANVSIYANVNLSTIIENETANSEFDVPSWFNVLNATASQLLSEGPYNFPASSVGLAFIAPIIGVLLAALYTGPLSDYLIVTRSRR